MGGGGEIMAGRRWWWQNYGLPWEKIVGGHGWPHDLVMPVQKMCKCLL